MNIIGVVLCGGRSIRMGADKGLKKKGMQTWSQRAEEVLLETGIPVYISVNKAQEAVYKRYHATEALITDNNEAGGPLAGILSCHRQFPGCDLLILPSDMIYMKSAAPNFLLSISCLNPAADVVAYESNFLQTLCAVYKAPFLQELSERLSAGQLENFSLQRLVRLSKLIRIPVKSQEEEWFRNCNYEHEIYE